jgi:DNA-binding transcriptional MocR family regulator
MPSTRSLAEKHGINRSTVYKAYEELWTMGYIESRPGSYSVVRKRQHIVGNGQKAQKGLIAWEEKSSDAGRILHRSFNQFKYRLNDLSPGTINLASLELDPRLFPVENFRRCMNTVLVEQGGKLLGYGERAGYSPLRKTIAHRLRIHGISVSPEEILITNGSQNGIDLILKLLTVPGTPAAIESPTYSNVIPLLKYYQADIIGIPMKDNGMDLDYLEGVLQSRKPAFVYTMPNFHNPTGITTDQVHREKLLSLCEVTGVPIVEDAFEEEMKYFGKVALPIKSMDRNHLVIYVGTFSKVLFPGIRIGWIAADKEIIQRLMAVKAFSDLTTNTLLQAALDEFYQQGYYNLHVKRMHREYRKRMHSAVAALKEHLTGFDRVSWTEPAGGYLVWLQLKDSPLDEPGLIQVFQRHGVTMVPGTSFYSEADSTAGSSHHFRISISTLNEAEIKEGISRVGKAMKDIYK